MWQVAAFFAVTFVLLIFTRPFAVRFINTQREKTNYEGIIGKTIRIAERVDNIRQTGMAIVNGQEWTARSYDDKVKLPEGMVVVVKAVNGVKLIVGPQPGVQDVGEAGKDAAKEAGHPADF